VPFTLILIAPALFAADAVEEDKLFDASLADVPTKLVKA
tara:strand:+ start:699 stop:815 length:117 start_codon:yes stop_codon:yes gene_type:complete